MFEGASLDTEVAVQQHNESETEQRVFPIEFTDLRRCANDKHLARARDNWPAKMRWFKRSTESPKLLSLSPLRHSESGNVFGNEPGTTAHRRQQQQDDPDDRLLGTLRRRSAGDGGAGVHGRLGMNLAAGASAGHLVDGCGRIAGGSVPPAGLANSPSSSSNSSSGSAGSSSSGSSPSTTNSSNSSSTSTGTTSSPFSYTSDSNGSTGSSTSNVSPHKFFQSGTATTPRKSRIVTKKSFESKV
uniref:Uncharacterized protein n=1 Tax=Anopheles atroparvus TaxID=41427 RepID=A0A182J650_ANOAO